MLRLDPALMRTLDELAEVNGHDRSELVRLALQELTRDMAALEPRGHLARLLAVKGTDHDAA